MDIPQQINTTQAEEEIEPFLEVTPELVQKRRSQGRIIYDRFIRNKTAIMGAIFLIVLVLFCFLGPLLRPVDPNAIQVTATDQSPSLLYPFGTDNVGRDE